MKPTLGFHEITIAHNAGHDASFACVQQNKVSFSAHVWNPMNRNVLCLSGFIQSINNKYREERTMVSYIARSDKLTISNLIEHKPT